MKFTDRLKSVRGAKKAALIAVSILCIGGAVAAAALHLPDLWFQILSYVFYALSALSLAYLIYVVICFVPKMKTNITRWAQNYEFTDKLLHDYGYRTVAFGLVTWAVSVAYALFQGTLAVLSHSVWFGALAGYYLVLAFLRGGVILRGRKGETEEEKNLLRIRVYRTGGILLIMFTLALSAAVVQMVYANRAFEYAGLMIYASAAYAFYKIIMALYNLVKARKQSDFKIRAVRNINFADAAVSVLALQTAMFQAFSPEADVSLYNAVTGGAVCLLIVALGAFMFVRATIALKNQG